MRGRHWILSSADLRFPAPIIGVANGAFLPEEVLAGCDIRRIFAKRVYLSPRIRRHAFIQQPSRNRHFGGRRFPACAREAGYDRAIYEDTDTTEDDDHRYQCGEVTKSHHEPADFVMWVLGTASTER